MAIIMTSCLSALRNWKIQISLCCLNICFADIALRALRPPPKTYQPPPRTWKTTLDTDISREIRWRARHTLRGKQQEKAQ